MLIVLAGVLTVAAVLVHGVAPGGNRRVGGGWVRAGGGTAGDNRRAREHGVPGRALEHPSPVWPARLASALAGLGIWALLGGTLGLAGGVAAALLGPAALGRLETGARRRHRRALVAGAPLVADLLAASLAAGVPVERSVPVIARAVGSPVGDALALVSAHIRLGEPADVAWSRVADTPGLAAIATTVARATRSGAPLAGMLVATAEDLRAQAAAAALAEVRATSVRAVLPLGLCLLPAFALLGIVPVVAGLIPVL